MFQLINYEEMPQLFLFYRNMFQLLLFFFSIGFFIFGMMLLRTGLFTLSAPSLNQWITTQPESESTRVSLIKGILITAVIQNSAAEMVIKLVSARLVTVARSIGIILGTLIGTAMINEVITLDIGALIIPIIVIGGILLFKKRKRVHNSGKILLGLALIFGSMWFFEYLAVPLNELDIINKIILTISHNYFYAILAGIIIVGTSQSIHAILGIVMAFLSAGIMELDTGIAIMLGANIGTCIDVLFVGFMSRGKEGRLTAYAYTLINIIGVTAFYPFISLLTTFGQKLSMHPDVQLAHVSVIFAIITSLIILPFANQLKRLL